ncbi:hypothetical protein POL68_29740 [Stigmatella sp. ncwal1]|uniref:Uncharacterized protein n=1 Tax=Stigmatella ashevillensis TaxID=2995309 RepID=A0ABT5DJZ1_9BACT|nr:hypothetical protein [Stigmatella ashevillena]MDC0712681.1 hypothetical protein [Stigmatella ashevillena]
MQQKALEVQVYSEWQGQPFFLGQPEKGRQVYIDTSEDGFVGYGVMEGTSRIIFEVVGTFAERPHFEAQMQLEGAALFIGPPPMDTNTVGDKSDSGTNRPGSRALGVEAAKAAPVPGRAVPRVPEEKAAAIAGQTEPKVPQEGASAVAALPLAVKKEEP